MTKRHRDVVNFLINDPNAPTIEYRYRPGPQVRDGAEYVFARLQAEDALTGLPPEQFIRRLGTYWGSVDSVHPFRDGNTRTETVFFHQLCRNAGYLKFFHNLATASQQPRHADPIQFENARPVA